MTSEKADRRTVLKSISGLAGLGLFAGLGGTAVAQETASPEAFVEAISADDFASAVDSVEYTGVGDQLGVFSESLQSFPVEGGSFGVISSGVATEVSGEASEFISTNLGGESEPFPEGEGFDVATLTIEFTVPEDATAVNFDYQYGTEENPSFLGSDFQDFFIATLRGPDGYEENISVLPNGDLLTVDNALEFSNEVQGSSESPKPPLPDPNDVALNAVTQLLAAQNATSFEELGLQGEQLTLELRLGDASDPIYDAAALVDNLTFGAPAGTPQPSLSFLDQESSGASVVVDAANLPSGGYIVIHADDGGSPGEVLGHSEYIEPGTVSSFAVSLDGPISADQTLFAMLHKDTDDDQTYEFPDADGPYTNDAGDPIVDDAEITVTEDGETEASVTFEDQDSDGSSVVVQNTTLPDGGFLVVHDESGAVLGHSAYLDAGTNSNVEVSLDSPISSDQTLIAMAHTDDGDESYEFPGADGPYTTDGAPVTDDACVQVIC
jgi:hypothetical protein